MVFNSISFFIFFVIFFFVYWQLNNKANIKIRNLFTIIASYLFYGLWDWRFLSLIFLSSIIDYTIGIYLGKFKKELHRKLLIYTSIVVNLGILGFFKYFNFFIDSLNHLTGIFSIQLHTSTLEILLPVGISFYTFQTLSYSIDVYKRRLEPTKDVLSFFSFVSFFPQLVAGPIERASHLLQQFEIKKTFCYKTCVSGLRLMLWGYFKKIVIADNFSVLSDQIFNADSTNISGLTVWAGALFFALQIYADFSAYSDIAIGLSRMLGYDLMKNFATPYFSSSFGEFWQRWHISLSTWFRDYVYIPMGGSRKGLSRTHINVFITFLLSGLWHGAHINFVLWGSLHGIVLIVEKQIPYKLNRVFATPLVLILVVLFWIPFRAVSFDQLQNMTSGLINFSTYSLAQVQELTSEFSFNRLLALGIFTFVYFIIEFNMQLKDFSEWIDGKHQIIRYFVYYLLIIILFLIGNFSIKPSFIYFQF